MDFFLWIRPFFVKYSCPHRKRPYCIYLSENWKATWWSLRCRQNITMFCPQGFWNLTRCSFKAGTQSSRVCCSDQKPPSLGTGSHSPSTTPATCPGGAVPTPALCPMGKAEIASLSCPDFLGKQQGTPGQQGIGRHGGRGMHSKLCLEPCKLQTGPCASRCQSAPIWC